MSGRRIARGSCGAIGAAFVATITACDPCAGVMSCRADGSRIALEGRVLDPWNAAPAKGAVLTLRRSGGVQLDRDSVVVITDADGRFELAAGATESGNAIVDVTVKAPDAPAYVVRGLQVATTERRGQGVVLAPWSTRLHFVYSAELYYRVAPARLVASTPVEFRRTGGTQLYGNGVVNGVYHSATDAFGRVPFFGDSAYAESNEDLVGDLTVTLAPPYGRTTSKGVRLTPSYEFRPPIRLARLGAGPSLEYAGVFHLRATLKPVVGMQISFKRTGGVPVQPEQFSALTNADGAFIFPLIPLAEGVLLGDLSVTPPPPAAPFTLKLQMPTLQEDGARLFGRWGIGPHLLYYGRLVARGVGVPNVAVELRRTSGIAVDPATFIARTDALGYFPMSPAPLGYGEATFELDVKATAPYAPFVVRGIRMTTSEEDLNGARPFGAWDIETQLKLALR